MSLVGTLAKVALGVAMAKGASYVFAQRDNGPNASSGAPSASGNDDLMGSILGRAPNAGQAGSMPRSTPTQGGQPSLGDMVDSVLGGQGLNSPRTGSGSQPSHAQTATGGQPNLQDLLGSLLGSGSTGSPGIPGGLGGLLEQLAGGGVGGMGRPGATAGEGAGLDAVIGSLASALGGAAAKSAPSGGSTEQTGGGSVFGDLLNQSLRTGREPKVAPALQQEAAAGLMLKAMLQAAKCDGELDDVEKQKIMQALGDASPEDVAFVNRELAAPVDVAGLVRHVPKGLEQQIYTVSVLGIDLDSQSEARYLATLSKALGMNPQSVYAIHAKLGVRQRSLHGVGVPSPLFAGCAIGPSTGLDRYEVAQCHYAVDAVPGGREAAPGRADRNDDRGFRSNSDGP